MKQQKVKSSAEIFDIPQELILPNINQPRKRYDYDELEKLAKSIRENGILQPVTVRRTEDKRFELVSGERRLRAARLVGLTKIPAVIADADAKTSAVMSITENLQRQQLDFFEEAEAIEQLIGKYNMSLDEASERLGISVNKLSDKLKILTLSEEMRYTIIRAGLTERHARALLELDDDTRRSRALSIMADRRLTADESERLIEQMLKRNKKPKNPIKGIRDVRVFVNTLNHAVEAIRRAGVDADAVKSETEEYIEYTVRIPKIEQLKISLPGDADEAV